MADLLMKMPIPYEPKRANRFIMRFPSTLGINEWFVEAAKRPSIKINSTPIPFLNTSTYVAGRFEWSPISVTFRDPIGPSASQALMEWVRLCAESVTGRMGYAAGYKKNVDLVSFGSNQASSPEQGKIDALTEFLLHVKNNVGNLKELIKNGGLITKVNNSFMEREPMIGFSDDDLKNIEKIKGHFDKNPKNNLKTYSTYGGIKKLQ